MRFSTRAMGKDNSSTVEPRLNEQGFHYNVNLIILV